MFKGNFSTFNFNIWFWKSEKMTTLLKEWGWIERNEDCATVFLKWMDFRGNDVCDLLITLRRNTHIMVYLLKQIWICYNFQIQKGMTFAEIIWRNMVYTSMTFVWWCFNILELWIKTEKSDSFSDDVLFRSFLFITYFLDSLLHFYLELLFYLEL